MPHSASAINHNRMLTTLLPEDWAHLAPLMRVEHPPRGRVLTSRGQAPAEIWFPQSAVVALTVTDNEGRNAQTGIVGPEGCVGAEALLEQGQPVADAAVQIEGDLTVIPVRQLRPALLARPAIGMALAGYLLGLSLQTTQVCACNRLHSLENRCCSWLLLMSARTGGDDLPLTQETLAALLGGSRSRINVALGALERQGMLRRGRGHIVLLSPAGLARKACECHRIIERGFTRSALLQREQTGA
jgi:CRP-like cAMP-binding protein